MAHAIDPAQVEGGARKGIAVIGLATLLALLPLIADAAQHRSATARKTFTTSYPCPATGKPSGKCTGYIVDHVIARKCGGADSPANVQWQTVDEAKAKDRVE